MTEDTAYLTIVSLRAVRDYADRPIEGPSLDRILQAGRATGSSQNKQPWHFFAVRRRTVLDQLAEAVYAPENLRRCQAAVALAHSGRAMFDGGRCAQNMMLAAWTEGIGSAPNGVRDADTVARILGLDAEYSVVSILSLGYPTRSGRPSRDVTGILTRIKRKPLEQIVTRID